MLPSLALSRKGFTLIEMVTTLAIVGIASALFYMIWVTNVSTMENHISRADLWNDANAIVERLSVDVREASQITLNGQGTPTQTATLRDAQGNLLATYRMSNAGVFEVQPAGAGNFTILTGFVDYANSSFALIGKGLALNLTLFDRPLHHLVSINASTEIYPRN